MPAPNIPAAKRAGLFVDLERLVREGDGWLTPEDRYALKTHGVCTQAQDGVFMVRLRIPGGALLTEQARTLAHASHLFGSDWVHLTTRQNAELHWVESAAVSDLLDHLARGGLTTRSSCGHTLRNVLCSEDAGVGLDEPFDCLPDARAVSDALVARSAELNCVLPSRVNLSFGGSPRCREDALLNDGAFVSTVGADGRAGYEVWAGGSLGKSPRLALRLAPFVGREDVVAAAEALMEVFVAHGDIDQPARGRMKYAIEALGESVFRQAWTDAFDRARSLPRPAPAPVEVVADDDRVGILRVMPVGGWSAGVRPQRTPGLASLTVEAPMGDLYAADLQLLADLADRHADGALCLSRDQNVVLRNVAVDEIPAVRASLARRHLALVDESPVARIRACTGSSVCALGVTSSPDAGAALLASPSLARNPALRIHVSGCPNSCAQHQASDIGLAGSKVRVGGRTVDGYQVFLGADLEHRRLGQVAGRIAADDVPAAVDAVVGTWEAMRHPGEPLGRTVRRIGDDAFAAHIEAALRGRWETGPDADGAIEAVPASVV